MLSKLTPMDAGRFQSENVEQPQYNIWYAKPDVQINDAGTVAASQGIANTTPVDYQAPTPSTSEPTPATTVKVINDPTINEVFTMQAREQAMPPDLFKKWYDIRVKRYEDVKSMTPAQLAAAGITVVNGTYFKSGTIYISKNDIETIEAKNGLVKTTTTTTNDTAPIDTTKAPTDKKVWLWALLAIVLIFLIIKFAK